MSTAFVIKVPKVKAGRRSPVPPTKIMRDRRDRRPKDARRKREQYGEV
jgi:hypothetical protein